jgi:peptidoglycan-N-acetylglucosamine deacetylase
MSRGDGAKSMSAGTVCLTFDFDAVSLWMSRGMRTPAPVSRGEFGPVAVPRILELLGARSIPTTWFIPGHTIETYPEVCQEVVDAGHEVALHGYAHENVALLRENEEREVFKKSYALLGEFAGRAPRGFRAPAWDLSSNTIEIMGDLGLEYDSSLMGHDYSPYYSRVGDEIPAEGPMIVGAESNVVEVPVSWALDDYPHFEFVRMADAVMPGLKPPQELFDRWIDELHYMLRDFENGVVTYTCHPQVIGRGHRMLGLEAWLDELAMLDVRYCRVAEVAAEFSSGVDFGVYRPASSKRRDDTDAV